MKKNCYTCRHLSFGYCEYLEEKEDYQAIKEGNLLFSRYAKDKIKEVQKE